MKVLSYSARLKLKKILLVTAAVLAAVLILCIGRIVYLQRYVVYDENGVHLDYSGKVSATVPNQDAIPVGDFILEQEQAAGESIDAPIEGQLATLSGVYFTASQLMDEATAAGAHDALENANAVMLDVKTATGKYLYATSLPDTARTETDITPLISQLAAKTNLTLIARLSAFRDSAKALSDFSQALPIAGGALWMDANGSYCLDPAGEEVTTYLIAIARELSQLGFDEIVFDDFSFPVSGNIRYHRDTSGAEAALQAAKTIAEQLSLYDITFSFVSTDPEITALSARAFLPAETGDLVSETAREYSSLLPGSDARLVFLTASRDTRFETYSVLSPYTAED